MVAINSETHNPFVRYWLGHGPLWRVYWLYGVLVSAVLAAVYWAALTAGDVLAQQALIPILFVYTLWIVVSVWRCAPNVKRELYTHLARGLTVVWALNTIFVLGALQLELVGVYLG